MRILSSGTSGVVVETSAESPVVYKIYLDKRSLQSFCQETHPTLWKALNSIDSEERWFVKAHPVDDDLAQVLFSNDFQNTCWDKVVQVRTKKHSKPQTTERLEKPKILCCRRLVPLSTIAQKGLLKLEHKNQLQDGLTKLHAAGIVHLDLHRWNILWDPLCQKPKIIDWGEWALIEEPLALTQRLVDVQAFLNSFVEIFACVANDESLD